jgi:hypothetical protein
MGIGKTDTGRCPRIGRSGSYVVDRAGCTISTAFENQDFGPEIAVPAQ